MQLSEIGTFSKLFKGAKEYTDLSNEAASVADKVVSGLDRLTKKKAYEKLTKKGITGGLADDIIELSNVADTVDDVADATRKLAGTNKGIGKLSSGFKGLGVVMKNAVVAHPIVTGVAAVTAALGVGYVAYKKYKDGLVATAGEATSAWNETSNDISSKMEQVKTLKLKLETEGLSEAESIDIRSQILDLQGEITSTYGSQAAGIDLVNGSLETQLQLMQNIQSKEAKSNVNKNQNAYEDAQYEMTEKQRQYNLGSVFGAFDNWTLAPTNQLGEEIASIAKEHGLNIIGTPDATGMTTGVEVSFFGNAEEADTVVDSFMTDIRGLQDKYGDDNPILQNLISGSGNALEKNQKILDDYQDNYQAFLEQSMYAEGFESGKPADVFTKYAEAVENYNKALASGNSDSILKARSAFNDVKDSVDATLKDSPQYSSLFNDVGEQLDKSSQKLFDFKEATESSATDDNIFAKSAKDIKNFGNKLKDLGLDKADVSNALLTEGNQAGEVAIQKLAAAWGLASDSPDEINAFADSLANIGIVSGGAVAGMEEVVASAKELQDALTSATESQSNINSALQNSVSSSGLTTDDVNNLESAFSNVAGFNTPELLEKTASGLRLNHDALAAYQSEQEKVTKSKFSDAIKEQNKQLYNQVAALNNAKRSGDQAKISSAQAALNTTKGELENLELLQAQYNGLTSDYAKFMSALSGNTEEGAMYDNAASGYQTVKELFKEGWTGTDKAKTGLDYYWSGDASNLSPKEIESTWKELQPLLDTWYNVTDSKGNVLPMEGIKNFVDDVNSMSEGASSLNKELKAGTLNLQDLSNAFGISEEAGMDLVGKLQDAGWTIDVEGITSSLDDVTSNAEAAQRKIKRLTGDTYEWDFKTADAEKSAAQVERAEKQLSPYQTDEGYDYSKIGATEAAQVYEATVRQQQETSKPVISNIDSSSVAESSKAAFNAAQNLQNAKDELDVQTQLASQGLNNNLESAQQAADNALNTYRDLQKEGKDPFDIDTSGLQEAEDSMAKITNEDLEVKVGADTSEVKSDIDSTGEKTEIDAVVKLDQGSVDAIATALNGGKPIEIPATVKPTTDGNSPVNEDEIPTAPFATPEARDESRGYNTDSTPPGVKFLTGASDTLAKNFGIANQEAEKLNHASQQTSQSIGQSQEYAQAMSYDIDKLPIKKMGIGADDIANGFQKAANFAGEVGEKIGEAFTGEKVSGAALDEPLSDTTDKLSEIDGKTSTATVDVETNGEEEVKTVDESLEKTDGKTAKATVDVDASSAESSISGLETEETEIPVTVKMDEGQFGTLYEGLTGEPLPLEMQPTISGNTDPELTQLTNEAPIQKKVEVSTEGAGDKFLGELTAEDFQKTITVNEEKGTEVTTEEAEPVTQTVNQELGAEVTTEEPDPVTQEVQQQVTKPLDTDLPPAQQEVERVPSNSVTEGVDTSGGTVTYDVQFTPDTPPPMEGGSVNYEVNFNPDAPPEMSGGSVEYSVKFNPNSPPAMTGGSVSYAVTFDPSSPPPMDGGSVSYTGDFPTTAPAITGTVNYKGNFPTSAPTISGVVNYTGNFPTSAPSLQSTITYYAHVVGAPHSAGTVSNSSFNAMANAHAGGTVNKTPKLKSSRFNDGYLGHAYVNPKDNGLKHDETALVNEVGGEAIVRDGKVMIMNNGYPSLASLKSGDIIFNHKQTAELMKKGYISNSHGKLHGSLPARATGTVNTGIPAHAEGSKSKWEKSYDFIQRRIESLEFQYKAHQDSSELAESLTKKNKYLDKALKDNKKLIASNEKGDRYYYEKAMSVGLSKELRDKVRTGDIRMEDYDEGTKQQIEDYSKMLDLSRQCREAVRDLKKEQKELANQKLENVLDYYDSKLGVLKGQQGYEAAKQKLNVATGHGGNRMVKERLNRQLKNQNQQTKLYEQQMAKYKETMKIVGKSSGKNSKDYRDALAQYNELKEAWVESKVAAQEYKNEIRDINYQWKQNKVDKYERGSDRLVGVREYYDTAKNISASKRGGIVAQQIKNNSNQIIEKKALADSYRKEQATLHFNDERYQELADLIANLDTEIINLGTDTIKLQDDIREIRWEGFENGMTDINNRLQEFADIRSMISSDSMVNAEDGSLTDFGYANILLTADAMELNNQKIADYREAIEKLKEEEQNGIISKEKYNELVNQYQKEIRDAASANKDYKQSLIDMYETQINYENDALQDNITKRKNALKAKKEYYDYDKRIKKQNKDINSLKAQISALQGATNAADIAKRLRLEEQLADLMDEKDDDVRDHAYDLQIDGYDKLADAADESLKKTENALATSTQAQQQCVDNMLNKMTSSYSSAYGKVDEIVKSSGIAVSTSFQETIKNFDGLTEVGNITVDKFVQSINTKVIAGLNDLAQKIVNGTTSGNDTNAEASGDGLVHVQSVKLSKTSITIIEGESITLTAEVLPKNANVRTLDWSTNSDNIKISTPKGATNSLSKVITGVKTNGRGDACVVTVTTRDVVHKTATCKVRVTTKTASLLNQLKGKSNAGTSAVNKVLREFGYGQASQASMVQFASDLGVKDVTAKNVMNADKQKAIAEKLRARFEKDEKRAVVKSIIDSLPDENRSKEAISKLSQLNQYISSSTGKRLTQTGALQLAEAMRLVVPGDYDSWSTGDKNFVLDEFKKLGFAKGGKISSGHYLPSKLLNEVPGNNGDDGWITVQREEVVLNKNETRQLKMQSAIMSDILSNISNGYNGLENPSYDATQRNAIPTDIVKNAGNISFNYGNMIDLDIANVDKDVMPDLDRLLGKCIKQTKEELLKEFRKMGYR